MKQTLLLLTVILFSANALNAQLNLQHRFNDEVVLFYKANGDVWYREASLWEDSVMTIYKSDFSVYKEIEIPSENYAGDYFNVYFLSDKLFNTDDKLEYLLTYYVPSEYNLRRVLIANEDGLILHDFGNLYSVYPEMHSRTGKSPVLMIGHADMELQAYVTDIYYLPGSSLSVPKFNPTTDHLPAPNPSSSFITIPYKTTGMHDAILTICNSAGMVVERHMLDSNQNKLTLDVSMMPKGVYIYNYGTTSGKFIVQ